MDELEYERKRYKKEIITAPFYGVIRDGWCPYCETHLDSFEGRPECSHCQIIYVVKEK